MSTIVCNSGPLIALLKPMHSRRSDRHAARFIAEATAAYRSSGRCPTVEELERLANERLCPHPALCLYYEPATCAVGYHVRHDDYFEYRVREERWYSSDELRANRLGDGR